MATWKVTSRLIPCNPGNFGNSPIMHETSACSVIVATFLFSTALCLAWSAAQPAGPGPNAPLPNATELLQRALANEQKLADEREKYECRVTDHDCRNRQQRQIKKDSTEVSDLFYVNGIPVERTLQKDGKDLSADDQHKQDDRVMKETLKYSNQANAQKEERQGQPGA